MKTKALHRNESKKQWLSILCLSLLSTQGTGLIHDAKAEVIGSDSTGATVTTAATQPAVTPSVTVATPVVTAAPVVVQTPATTATASSIPWAEWTRISGRSDHRIELTEEQISTYLIKDFSIHLNDEGIIEVSGMAPTRCIQYIHSEAPRLVGSRHEFNLNIDDTDAAHHCFNEWFNHNRDCLRSAAVGSIQECRSVHESSASHDLESHRFDHVGPLVLVQHHDDYTDSRHEIARVESTHLSRPVVSDDTFTEPKVTLLTRDSSGTGAGDSDESKESSSSSSHDRDDDVQPSEDKFTNNSSSRNVTNNSDEPLEKILARLSVNLPGNSGSAPLNPNYGFHPAAGPVVNPQQQQQQQLYGFNPFMQQQQQQLIPGQQQVPYNFQPVFTGGLIPAQAPIVTPLANSGTLPQPVNPYAQGGYYQQPAPQAQTVATGFQPAL